jgi:hypothetical protein
MPPSDDNRWWIVRRLTGTPNGKGGYTDAVTDVASYAGRTREAKRGVDPTDLSGQGAVALTERIAVFDLIGMNVTESDRLIEGEITLDEDEEEVVTEKVGGEKFEITNVRKYALTTQLNLKATE